MVSHKHCEQPPDVCPQLPNVRIEIRNFLTDYLLCLMFHTNGFILSSLEDLALRLWLPLPAAGVVGGGAPYTVHFHYGRLQSGARLTAEDCERRAWMVRANSEGRVTLYAHFLPAGAVDTGICSQVRDALAAERRERERRGL